MIRRQFVLLLLLSLSVRLQAAVHVWTGAASNRFSDAGNWIGGSPAGDAAAELSFPGGMSRLDVNNDIAGLTVRSMSFAGGGYVLRGAPVTLADGAELLTATPSLNEIAADVIVGGGVSVIITSTAENAGRLVLSGAISGSGSITKRGRGTLVYTGTSPNTYSGSTTILDGELRLEKRDNTDAIAGELFIDSTGVNNEYGSVSAVNREQIRDSVAIHVGANAELHLGAFETLGPLALAKGAKVYSSIWSETYGGSVEGSAILAGDITVVPSSHFDQAASLSGTFGFSGTRTVTTCSECPGLGITASSIQQPPGASLIIRGDDGESGNGVSINGTYEGSTLIEGARAGIYNPNTAVRLRSGRFGGSVASLVSERGTIGTVTTTGDLRLSPLTTVAISLSYDTSKLTAGGVMDLHHAKLDISRNNGSTRTPGERYLAGVNKGAGPIVSTFSGIAEGMAINGMWRVSYKGGDGNDLTFEDVGRFTTSLTLGAESLSTSQVQLTARVYVESGIRLAPQQITFSEGSTTLGTAAVTNGVASITVAPAGPGRHEYTATFPGTAELSASSATGSVFVPAPAPVLTSVEPSTLQSGTPVTVILRGSNLLPGGAVTLGWTRFSILEYVSTSEVRFQWPGWFYESDNETDVRYSQPASPVETNRLPIVIKGLPTPKTLLQFETRAIVAPVIAGGGAAWISVASAFRTPGGAIREFRNDVTPDSDKDGLARWEQKDDVPKYGFWLAADMKDGKLMPGQQPDGLAIRANAFPRAMFVRNGNGDYAHIVLPLSRRWYVLWVRPGVGAWNILGGEGFAADDDDAVNGYWMFDVSKMKAVGTSPAPPAGVQRGDTFAAIEWYAQEWFGDRVDEHLRESDGPGLLRFAADSRSYISAKENAGSARLVVTRTGGSDGEVTVNYRTEDGTAKAGVHYGAVAGRLTFAPGEVLKVIDVPVINDAVFSGETRLRVVLSDPAGTTLVADATSLDVVIDEDDPAPRLTAQDVTVNEGDEGMREVSWIVSISGATRVPVTAFWAYSLDYSGARQGTVTFTPGGATSQALKIRYTANRVPEPNRNYTLSLSDIKNAAVDSLAGHITVIDDDFAELEVLDATVIEGTRPAVLVTISAGTYKPVTVKYTTVSGTASEGSDFTRTSGTLEFSRTSSFAQVIIPIAADEVAEGAETFTLVLSDITGGRLRRASAVVTILDAPMPVLTAAPGLAREGQAANFRFVLSMPSKSDVRFRVTTVAGTATSPKDFAAKEQTLTIPAGSTEASFTVQTERDAVFDPSETFS
ncbi:MAG: Ig-like domain repeat protein, partial [Acidobacteriota bacterium]|nr:Ig-like domain repeat protein [Acidobacteriota bacterium]